MRAGGSRRRRLLGARKGALLDENMHSQLALGVLHYEEVARRLHLDAQ